MSNAETYEKLIITQKAILIRAGRVLLMETAQNKDVWELPGGRIERGEDARTAFARELREELGLETFVNRGVVDYGIYESITGKRALVVVNLIETAAPIVISTEHTRMKWIRSSEIDDHRFFFPEVADILRKGFNEKIRNSKH